MSRSLVKRMIVRVWGSTMLLLLGILAVTYLTGKRQVIRGTEAQAHALARSYAERFNGESERASAVARTMAAAVATQPLGNDESLGAFMKSVLAANPHVYGTCLAFAPHAFDDKQRLYAPYYYRSRNAISFRQLGNPTYDYLGRDWYRIPARTGQPLWSEPYDDEGGGDTLMVTYSHPFQRDGKPAGVATIDISLAQLAREVGEIRVLRSGYGFIVTRSGRYVAYPDESKILRSTIGETRPDLARRIADQPSGFVETMDPLRGKPAWVAFNSLGSSHLTLGIVYPAAEALEPVYDFELRVLWVGAIGMLVLLLLVALVSRSITAPIIALARGARQVASGNLDLALPAPTAKDEVRQLTDAFNTMVRELKNRLVELQKTTSEKERIVSELAIAREIQLSLLPDSLPRRSGDGGFDLCGRSLPARQVGGDFYDFFRLDDDRIGIAIGDVSDKGVPAALFMALSRTLLRATAMRVPAPDACLEQVNRLLCPENRQNMFVTLFYGVVNMRDGSLWYCNAGHLAPLLLTDGAVRPIDSPGGMALGVFDDASYRADRLVLEPPSAVFLYTDGLTDAVNPEGADFGLGRLEALLAPLGGDAPQRIVDEVFAEVERHAGTAEQFDDLTTLVLRVDQLATDPMAEHAAEAFDFAADLQQVPLLARKISTLLERRGYDDKAIFAVNLVLEELIVNVISYGYDDDAAHSIRVEIHHQPPDAVRVVLVDDGKPFDPRTSGPPPRLDEDVSTRPVGGLGLHLTREMVDAIDYRRVGDRNVTTFVRKLHQDA
jgi:sigma-B regulation protein RsbU (phosphoserine phosphatase)